MNDVKHTPGPWRHCSASDGKCKCGLIWGPDEKATVATINTIECDFQDHGWAANHAEEVRLANIALVCAAPDLLAACEDIEAWFSARIRAGILNANVELDRIRSAIAKARGQSS